MRFGMLVAAVLVMSQPVFAASLGRHVVVGVEEGDMLKLREGPGTGYVVIVGLPNGTEVVVQSCERIGSARWCRVSLERARSLKGYVSGTYLQKK